MTSQKGQNCLSKTINQQKEAECDGIADGNSCSLKINYGRMIIIPIINQVFDCESIKLNLTQACFLDPWCPI
jgi:hypothetical protein